MTAKIVTYRCDCCGRVVRAGTGYVHVNHDEIEACRQSEQQFEDKLRQLGDGLHLLRASELPDDDSAVWRVHHRDCDPQPDTDDYCIDVERIDTHEKLLAWTAHLLDKTWLRYTDWSRFLYSKVSREAAAS